MSQCFWVVLTARDYVLERQRKGAEGIVKVLLGSQELIQSGEGIYDIICIPNELGQEAIHFQPAAGGHVLQDRYFKPCTCRGVSEGLGDLPEDPAPFAGGEVMPPEEEA